MNDSVAMAALGALDMCILLPEADGRLVHTGRRASWLAGFLDHADRLEPSRLPVLEHFLEDARRFWALGRDGAVESPMWVEQLADGTDACFEARAIAAGDLNAVLLRRCDADFAQRQALRQAAHDQSLARQQHMREVQKKEVLIHCIVHDLAGPLTGIMGCLSLLRGMDLDDQARALVDVGLRQSNAQEGLIRSILDAFAAELESMDAVELDAASGPDLIGTTEEVVDGARASAELHGVEVVVQTQAEAPLPVVGDDVRLRRVIANLLDNALRYAPRGSQIAIRIDRDGERASFSIEDRGPGVPDELASSIFDKFARATKGYGKAGLGLYFCRMTISRWHGEIGYAPVEPTGSRFWFSLPTAGATACPDAGSTGQFDPGRQP